MITPSSAAYTNLNNLLGRCPLYRVAITKGPPNIQPPFTHHWPLDEVSGTRERSYPFGSAAFIDHNSVGSTAGQHGLCATFNGTNQYLSQAGTIWGVGDISFYVRAWVYMEANAGTMAIVGQYNASNSALQSWLLAYDSGLARFTFTIFNSTTGSAQVAADSLGTPNLNTWYDVRAWRYPGLSSMIYIQVNTETVPGAIDSTDGGTVFPQIATTEDLRIGAAGGIGSPPVVGDFWKGAIDEVTICIGYIPSTIEQSIISSGSLPVPADLYTTYTFDTAHDVNGEPSAAISSLHVISLERQLEMAYSRFPLSTLTFFLKNLTVGAATFISGSAGAACTLNSAFWELPGESATLFTGYITNIRADRGMFTITAQSKLSVALNSLIFTGAQTQLSNSINAFLTSFPVKDEGSFQPIGGGGETWIAIDNELIPYVAVKPGEIVSNTRMNDNPFKVLPPLVPDGQAVAHSLGATVRELVGLGRMSSGNMSGGTNDMHPLDHMKTVITGIQPNGGLANNKQTVGFSNRLSVNLGELILLRNVIGNEVQFLFLDDEPISVKDFLEKELALPCGFYPTENAAGEIGGKPYPVESDFVALETIDDSHVLDIPEWDRGAEVHINQVIYYYDYLPTTRQYLSQATFIDDDLLAQHGRELPLVIYSKGIRSPYDEADLGIGTNKWFQETPRFLHQSAKRHLSRFGSRSAVLRCETILRDNLLETSDDVTGIFTNVPDEINGDDNINRPFKVIQESIDFIENKITFGLLEHTSFQANVHKVPFGLAPANLYYTAFQIATGQVPSLQTNFTAVIKPTDNRFRSVENGGYVASLDSICVYADPALTSLLPFWLVPGTYDPVNGSFEIWVKIAAQDGLTVYIGYGDPTRMNTGTSAAVWDSNFKRVYPFGNGTTLSLVDLTGHQNGTAVNTPTAAVGLIGGCALFVSASTQYITCGILDFAAVTFSVLINATSFPNAYNTAIGRYNSGGDFAELFVKSNGKLACYLNTTLGGVSYDGTGSHTLVAGTPYRLDMSYDSVTGLVASVNGVSDGAAAANGPLVINSPVAGALHIADDPGNLNRNFNGKIDQVEVSDIFRNADWKTTRSNNQLAPNTFWSMGPQVLI